MSINLKRLVSSLILLSSIMLNAKEIPITQEVEITIPVGKFAVVEFPFKISHKNITSFLVSKNVKSTTKVKDSNILNKELLNNKLSADKLKGKLKGKKKGSSKRKSKGKYLSITQNINGFTFFARKEGVIKMVVWGYEHPILLTVRAKRKDGFGLYQFVVPLTRSKEVLKTEQGSHEKIINKLMVHLFNQTLPRGYKSLTTDKIYNSNSFEFRLNRQLIGKRYIAEEWILTNNSKEKSVIHEESLYQKGIYGISLEVDTINPHESIRVFIVRSGSDKRQKAI